MHLEELADVLASGHKLRLVTKPERDHAMAGKGGGVQSKTDGYGLTLSAERDGTGLIRMCAIGWRRKSPAGAAAFASRSRRQAALSVRLFSVEGANIAFAPGSSLSNVFAGRDIGDGVTRKRLSESHQ